MGRMKNYPLKRLAEAGASGILLKHTPEGESGVPVDFPHRDDYFIFSLVCEGGGAVSVDFTEMALGPGQGIVIMPGQVHCREAGAEASQLWTLFLAAEFIPDADRRRLEEYALSTAPIDFSAEDEADLRTLFGLLLRHRDDAEFARSMATAIVRLFSLAASPARTPAMDRYAGIALRFKRLLEEHLTEEKQPSAYAAMLHLSTVYLNEAVKGATGISAGVFIRSRVVLEAKRQLTHTTRTVQEIATALGYDDCSYFARLFKKDTGVTPSDYRKNLV